MAGTDGEMTAAECFTFGAGGKRLEGRWIPPQIGDSPTLVFVHDGLGCVSLWGDFPDRFARATGCGALIYSRAGYGASESVSLPRRGSLLDEDALDVLPAALGAAGIRRAVLVAQGEGASIALINAGVARDGRVAGLLLMGPNLFKESIARAEADETRKAYFSGGLRSRLLPYHRDNVDAAFWGWSRLREEIASRNRELCASLSNVTVPSLMIQGARDSSASAWQLQLLDNQIGGRTSIVRLPRCGYAVYRDNPEAVIDVGSRFLMAEGLMLRPDFSDVISN